MQKIFLLFVFAVFPFFLSAQMVVGVDTLYGNEWINYSQSYYKIQVAEDGLYRVTGDDLAAAGIPLTTIDAHQYQIFHLGQEVPIHVSATGNLSNSDYISFVGQKNRTELESFLFLDPSVMLNPNFSLFTDTSAYFLTWKSVGNGLRYNAMTNDTTNHPTAEPYFLRKQEKIFTDYWAKKEGGSGSKFSHFDVAEGFSTSLKTKQDQTFSPFAPYLAGPDAQINVRYAGRGADHHQEIRINNTLITTDEYSGWSVRNLNFDVAASDLSSNISFKMTGLVNGANKVDRSRLAYLSLTYPQVYDFEGANQYVFSLTSTNAQYLEIINFDLSQGTPVLYDSANGQRFEGKINGSSVVFMLPQISKQRTLVLSAGDGGLDLGGMQSVAFIDYASANSDYLIVSNSRLYDDGNGHNYVQDYADYRASVAGGNYNPLVVDIQQIYDQFGYGIQRNPIGIRNMVQWAVRTWDDAKYLYILGKGRTYKDMRSTMKLEEAQATMFVPTFGSPGGDNLFVTSNYDASPRLAIGRLAVTEAVEIRIYLDKVIGLEVKQNQVGPQTLDGVSWKKKIVHLGGGGNANEKLVIKKHLNAMADTIQKTDFCGHTISFFKDVSDPIQQIVPEQIFHEINSGAAMITVFGHAGTGTFDFNIDNPDSYDNVGKYPIITSLGCYSGNIFTSQKGISERFCLFEEKGAIGFVASTNLGYISTLGSFGRLYYNQLGKQRTIGKGLQKVFDIYSAYSTTSDFRRLSEQLTLNGDPAIRVGLSPGVDFMIDYNSVNFGQSTISSRQDSILLDLEIINLGKNYRDSVSLDIKHVLPNGQVFLEKTVRFFPQGYKTPVHITWPNPGSNALGQNMFFAEVDKPNDIEELPVGDAELNNTVKSELGFVGLPFFISDNSTTPIEPREFAIKNISNLTLIASTSNAFAKETKYLIELDTTELFNSPLLEETAITQTGGLIKWQPSMVWMDSTVYYWQISPDSISPDLGYLWSGSSFVTTVDSVEGWNQSHFFQFAKDKFDDLEIKRDKDLEFSVNGFFFILRNKVKVPSSPPEFSYNYENSAVSVRPWNYLESGVAVFVGDQYRGYGWPNPAGGLYGSINPNYQTYIFAFPTNTEAERETLIHFLKDTIPDNSYVWFFSVLQDSTQDFHPELWANDSINLGVNLFSLLEQQGANHVRDLASTGSMPYTFVYKKGVEKMAEDIALNRNETIITEVFFPVLNTEGSLQTKAIGPALSWGDLKWKSINVEPDDSDTLSIWGLNQTMTDTTLLFANVNDFEFSLASIDAHDYPFLILKYDLKDDVFRSANDLSAWSIYYSPYPELALNPQVYYKFNSDTIDYGNTLQLDVAWENISSIGMDSVLYNVNIIDKENNSVKHEAKWGALPANGVDTVHFEVLTTELSKGINRLILEANPNNNQLELFHGNNFGVTQFYVKGDSEKPILDVFFDGERILNGDLVSAQPEIKIILTDENSFFLMKDTALLQMKIIGPNMIARRISFQNPQVEFTPALATSNTATVTYNPIFTQSGEYTLIISAKDVSGNPSGAIEPKVSFRVILEKMISNVLPFPNPFSTSTRFVYTLTGDSAPEYFKIQILNVVGKVVREITQDELGDLKVGTHLTDYHWDGRDEYGDLLANGTYLYRIIVKDVNKDSFKHFETGSDRFFHNSFGKIVILR